MFSLVSPNADRATASGRALTSRLGFFALFRPESVGAVVGATQRTRTLVDRMSTSGLTSVVLQGDAGPASQCISGLLRLWRKDMAAGEDLLPPATISRQHQRTSSTNETCSVQRRERQLTRERGKRGSWPVWRHSRGRSLCSM